MCVCVCKNVCFYTPAYHIGVNGQNYFPVSEKKDVETLSTLLFYMTIHNTVLIRGPYRKFRTCLHEAVEHDENGPQLT